MRLLVWFPRIPGRRDHMVAATLRGGPVFDLMLADKAVWPGVPTKVLLADEQVPMPTRSRSAALQGRAPVQMVFAPLGLLVDNPDVLETIVEASATLIVDVHFPLPDPDLIVAIQDVPDGERDQALDEAARDLWRDLVRVERAYDILRLADAVTVSPVLPGAYSGSGRPVVHLPDVKDAASAALFYRRFATLVWELGAVSTGWRRRWHRLVMRRLLWLASRSVRARVVIPEEAHVGDS